MPPALADAAGQSATGSILFSSAGELRVVLPPFPVAAVGSWPGIDTSPVEGVQAAPRLTLVLLLRLGGFAIGTYDRDTLVGSKTGTRFVKGRHKKGGSSQARFARRRAGQELQLFKAACVALSNHAAALDGPPDHVVFGGDRRTIASFRKACDLPPGLEPTILPRFLHVGEPRKATLERLPAQLYAWELITVVPEDPAQA